MPNIQSKVVNAICVMAAAHSTVAAGRKRRQNNLMAVFEWSGGALMEWHGVVVVAVVALLHFAKQLLTCALWISNTENDIVGVEAIDSLWFIDIMRAFILHVLHYIVCLPIYFQLMTVALPLTLPLRLQLKQFDAPWCRCNVFPPRMLLYRKLDGIVPRY